MNTKPDYNHLYEIAESQAGYFSAAQARQVSFSWERLSTNAKTGKFLRAAPGVYRLAHFPASPFEDFFVVWLKVGQRAVISHESALSLYDLSDALPGKVHVIVPRSASRRHPGIDMHTNHLEADEVTTRAGLPVTTVARTIVDTAASHLPEELVRQAVQEALSRGLVTTEELRIQAERQSGRVKRIFDKVLISGGAL